VSLVAESEPSDGLLARFAARQSDPLHAEYGFLVGRFIDRATLARASAIARQWGVHPHEVMIANGWLEAEDYYRALAQRCAAPFKDRLVATDVAPPALASPRQSLAKGVLKERARSGSFVFAPDRLRPNALSEMLARLSPYAFSLASPHAVRGAICHHFGPSLALHATEGLASRHPGMSARTRPALWQRLAVLGAAGALLTAMALAPVETIWAITLALAWLFVPLIALRLVAAYYLVAATKDDAPAAYPRVPDHELPIYTLLVPLYREAHMLPGLIKALTRLDYPAFGSKSTK
jgi:glycosyltransferase XagB